LLVTVTSRLLDRVDLMVVFVGVLASIITAVMGPPITIISVVVVALVATFAVVVPTTVIGFIIPVRWVLGA
jgi:Na+/serine symporter